MATSKFLSDISVDGDLSVTGSYGLSASDIPSLAASKITSGELAGLRLPWNDNDGFNGTYNIVWTASNELYRSSWLQVRGSDDMLLTRNIDADGDVTANNFYVSDDIIHEGDTNTNIQFDTDRVRIVAGGTTKFDSNNTYLTSINNGNWSGTDLSVANGGTGASSASAARTNLGLGSAATSASTDFVSATGSDTMNGTLTINTAAVPFNLIENGHTGTGKYWRIPLDGGNIRFDVDTTNTNGNGTFTSYTDVLLLRANGVVQLSNYGAGILKTDASGNISLDTSTYLTSINNGNWSGTDLSVANGGTGASTASGARTNLGLGSLATLSTVNASTITDNSVGAAELNVSGNGTSGQVLASDGDGTFSWVSAGGTGTVTQVTVGSGLDISNQTTTPYITLDLSELTDMTAAINTSQDELILLDNGAERRKLFSEIFGSNAYNSTTIPTNNNQLTNGAGYLTAHPNISAASSVNNSGRTYIQDITLDSNGHITAITSATETVTNTNTQLSNEQVQDIVGGMVSSNTETNISVTYDDTNGKLNFASTDTNTQLSDAQVRSKISGTGLIGYNSSTGVISTTANNYSLPAGSSSTRGGFKIGYAENGKNYPVEVSSEKMFVNVPWTDSNTNYYLNGISKSGNTLTFSVNGATNQTYTFGSHAFSSTTYDNYNDWKLVANDDTASNVRSANYVKFDGADISGSGTQGDPYVVSATGPQGPAGADGADGANGTNGTNGTNGSDGADGADGAMYGPDKYLFTTAQTYTSSGAVISIASQEINGSTNTSLASNRITFGSAGTYMVSWNINWQSLYANRSTFGATAKLNGTTIQGGSNIQYFRYNTYGHKSTTGTTFAVTVTANQYIEFKTFLHHGSANHKVTSTDGDGGAITITRIV